MFPEIFVTFYQLQRVWHTTSFLLYCHDKVKTFWVMNSKIFRHIWFDNFIVSLKFQVGCFQLSRIMTLLRSFGNVISAINIWNSKWNRSISMIWYVIVIEKCQNLKLVFLKLVFLTYTNTCIIIWSDSLSSIQAISSLSTRSRTNRDCYDTHNALGSDG